MATPEDRHFISFHPVLGAMGVSSLGLWEAEPTGWSSTFLNVPSATARRSEGEAEGASVLAVEERRVYVSTRLVAAETSLTDTFRLEQTCPQARRGRPGPGQTRRPREPFSKGS